MSDVEKPVVVFDLGGVLVRVADHFEDACARAGVEMPLISPAGMARHVELLQALEVGRIDEQPYLQQACAVWSEQAPVSEAVFSKVLAAWTMGMYEGAAELLHELRERGVATACLSNTIAPHWRTMRTAEAYRPLNLLGRHFASHEIGAAKPSREAYERVAKALGARPGSIMFFDDREENVQGANDVGWRGRRVDPADPLPEVRRQLRAQGVL